MSINENQIVAFGSTQLNPKNWIKLSDEYNPF